MSDIVEEVKQAIVDGDDDVTIAQIEQALEEGIDPERILKQAIVPGIERAGELWRENVYFMPDVVLSAEAFRVAMKAVEPHLLERKTDKVGSIVIGRDE